MSIATKFSRWIYKVVAITLFIILLIVGGVAFSLSILKEESIEAHLKIADLHANTMSDQIAQTFKNTSLTIDAIESLFATKKELALLEKDFTNILSYSPHIRSISVLDSKKVIVYSSNPKNIGIELEDEDFFPKPMFDKYILRFAPSKKGKDFSDIYEDGHSNFLPIIKMIRHNKEEYFIQININSDYFINRYATNLENNFARLDVMRRDGILLFSSQEYKTIGEEIPQTDLLKEALLGSGTSVGIENMSDKNYLSAYRIAAIYPLSVSVKLVQAKTLASWEQKRESVFLIITFLVVLSMILAGILIYRYKKEKELEIEFHKKELKIKKRGLSVQIKAKRNAQEASRVKGQFLANMSHEIRTPMNAILGLSELMFDTNLNEKQRDFLNKIHGSSKILIGIINDILDFSKIDAHKMELEHASFELGSILSQLQTLFSAQFTKKGIEFKSSFAPDLPHVVVSDALRIGQVLINFLSNALKFTHKGSVTFCIELKEKIDENHAVLNFSISDTGIGMSEEEISRIFLAFSQADSSTTRKYGGSGLGLVISKKIIEAMGSKIEVKSKEDYGTTFSFDLELEVQTWRQSREPNESIVQEKASKLPDLSGLEVLLVEDNEINQEVATMMLQRVGASVRIANNGKEGVEIFLANPTKFCLILMDLQMPIMSGYEAAKIIREHDKNIAIIALTAAAMIEDREKVLAAGMNEHLSKPINIKEFYEKLLKFCKVQKSPIALGAQNNETLQPFKKLETLEILDMEFLQKNLSSKELIEKLLLKLEHQLEGDFADITELVSSKDEQAPTKIHSLKGVSANLGAKVLALACTNIDAKYKFQEEVPQSEILALKEAIASLIKELKKRNFVLKKSDKQEKKYSKEELLEMLGVIETKLLANSIVDAQTQNSVYEGLGAYLQNEELQAFRDVMDDLEFERAAEILKEIVQKIN